MKVGDRNSTVGCTHSIFGIWNGRRKRVGSAQHALQLMPERQRPVEHMQFFLQQRSQLRQARAPFHQRRGDQPDHEGDAGADRSHDQNRRHRRAESDAARGYPRPATAWCRPRTPSPPGGRKPSRHKARRRWQMTSSVTSAKATTSARRMTGGCSALLSGSARRFDALTCAGVSRGRSSHPPEATRRRCPRASPSAADRARRPSSILITSCRATWPYTASRDRCEPAPLTQAQRFHRGNVKGRALDRHRRCARCERNCEAPVALVVQSHHAMRIERGRSWHNFPKQSQAVVARDPAR